MRIHTNQLTRQDMHAAAAMAGVTFYRLEERGSRSRARAFELILEGSGRTGTRYGQNADMIAATWDEWGIFLGELFRRDPGAVVPRVYESGEHFRWVTGGRFDTLTPDGQDVRHRWDPQGRNVTGAYWVDKCRKCGAVHRRLAPGRAWDTRREDIGGAA